MDCIMQAGANLENINSISTKPMMLGAEITVPLFSLIKMGRTRKNNRRLGL